MDNEKKAHTIARCVKQGSELGRGRPRDSGNSGFHLGEQQRYQRGQSDMWQNSTVEKDSRSTIGNLAKIQNADYKIKE